ncbi:MAG: methyltransferase domain-containing protein [Patescibacteria group bacterium]
MLYMDSVQETAYGFKTKLLFFIDRIEKLRLELGKGKRDFRILDIGCGNGLMITLPLGEQEYTVVGIDAHAPTIAQAKSKNHFKNVEFIAGDVKDLAHKLGHAGKFNIVVLSDILEHLSHPENLLNEVKNILSPHGIILISIPNGYGSFEIENFILRKLGILKLGRFLKKKGGDGLQTLNHESGHVQFFTMAGFKNLARETEFKISCFKKGSVFCGPVSGRILSLFPALEKFNVKSGRFLPPALCSVWYFELT